MARERYEQWCGRMGIPPVGFRGFDKETAAVKAAQAKRERKAAKRRRDAELTWLGQRAGAAWVELVSLWTRDHELGRTALMKRVSTQALMRSLRRGEAVP